MNHKTMPIFLAFLIMGVADAMGPMSDAAKDEYQISQVTAMMLPFFVFIAFAVFSVPGGLLAARIGKKKLLLLGLGLNALAMLIPSVINPSFSLLLGCIFTLGIGTTFLQVAGNPIMRDVSREGNYSRNLSFAQGIKGLGSTISTYLVGAIAAIAVFESMGWRGVFPVFFVLMAVAFVWVVFMKIDEAKADIPPSIGSSLSLLKKPVFSMAVLGIFLYVGAEVCLASTLRPQLRDVIGFADAFANKFGPVLFLLLLTIGRLLGGVVLTKMSPRNFFRVSAGLGLLGGLLLMVGHKYLAIAGVVAAGLGFANIWPMLFSITVEEDPKRANELSGLMCMAISGGAIVPFIMGWCVDGGMGAMAFVVPAICFGYLLMLSLKGSPKTEAAA
ncbi:MAG: MFS transporter [Phycisphaeraceae bacterium]|nr:MFS transporter [Phycisphaeraceae bacterium]